MGPERDRRTCSTFHGIRGTVIIRRGQGRVIDTAGQEVGTRAARCGARARPWAPRRRPSAIVLFDGTGVTKFEHGTVSRRRGSSRRAP